MRYCFFLNDTATTEIYTLPLHDALPIYDHGAQGEHANQDENRNENRRDLPHHPRAPFGNERDQDRKSTRLNSSHLVISYAVFCFKKKKRTHCRGLLTASLAHVPRSVHHI